MSSSGCLSKVSLGSSQLWEGGLVSARAAPSLPVWSTCRTWSPWTSLTSLRLTGWTLSLPRSQGSHLRKLKNWQKCNYFGYLNLLKDLTTSSIFNSNFLLSFRYQVLFPSSHLPVNTELYFTKNGKYAISWSMKIYGKNYLIFLNLTFWPLCLH